MTVDELQVLITANTTELRKEINKANTSISGLQKGASKSGAGVLSAFKTLKTGIVALGIGKVIKDSIQSGMDAIESDSLFDTSLGKYADAVRSWSDEVSSVLGLNAVAMRKNTGVIYNMTSSMGVAEDSALTLSKGIALLSEDMASFYNLDSAEAFNKLRAGLTGETEPLKALGILVDENTVKQVAYSEGIARNGAELTQQQKVLARYVAILKQTGNAQGDLARTIDSPSNQLRILKNQAKQLSITLSNFFIPMLNAVLPYLTAFAQVTTQALTSFARFLGIIGDSSGGASEKTEEIKDNVDSISSGMEDATKKAQKLKSTLSGFDEMNVLQDSTSDSTSSAGVGTAGGDMGFNLAEYDAHLDWVNSSVDEIKEKMKDIFWYVGAIGTGIAGWKLTDAVLGLTSVTGALQKLPILTGVTLTLAGIVLEIKGISSIITEGIDANSFFESLFGGGIIASGTAILGASLATIIDKAFGSSAVALAITKAGINLGTGTIAGTGAAIGGAFASVIAGIPMYITGIYDAIKNGLEWLNATLIGVGATLGGAGIGAIIGMLGGPIGAGVGVLIGLVVGLVTDFTIWLWQNYEKIKSWFTDLPTWAQVIFGGLGAIVGRAISPIIAIITGVVVAIKEWGNIADWVDIHVIQPVTNFFTSMWDTIVETFSPAVNWFGELFGSIGATVSDIFYNIGVIVSGCWEIIKAVWNIASSWFSEKILDPISNVFTKVWGTIKEGAKTAWEGIKSVFSPVATFFKDIFSKAWQGIVKVFSVAGDIFVDIKDGIVSAFKFIVNGLITRLNAVISVPFKSINTALNKIKNIEIVGLKPFSSLKTVSIPEIPKLARGGIIDSPTYAMIGEAGKEAVMPLERNTGWIDQLADRIGDKLGGVAGNIQLIVKLGEDTIFDRFIDYQKAKSFETNGEVFAV